MSHDSLQAKRRIYLESENAALRHTLDAIYVECDQREHPRVNLILQWAAEGLQPNCNDTPERPDDLLRDPERKRTTLLRERNEARADRDRLAWETLKRKQQRDALRQQVERLREALADLMHEQDVLTRLHHLDSWKRAMTKGRQALRDTEPKETTGDGTIAD